MNPRKVHCLTIDRTEMVYRCPHRECKAKYHYHHNDGPLHNRVEQRCSHCEVVKEEVAIQISQHTLRAILYKTFQSNNKILIEPLPLLSIQ